jgi:hypothetical protein
MEAAARRGGTGPGPGEADRRLGLHRPALEDYRRIPGEGSPAAEHFGHRHLGGPVEHDAERPPLLVRHKQHDCTFEVGVAQRRRRDEQLPG